MHIWMLNRRQSHWLLGGILSLMLLTAAVQRQPELPVISYMTAGKRIVVDAGHGGMDGGAVSAGGIQEKDISLALSQKLIQELVQLGCIVIPVRETDTDLAGDDFTGSIRERKRKDLQTRADIANRNQADVFLSIHLNADPSPRWFGAQVFFERNSTVAENLGKAIQEQLRSSLGNTQRQAVAADDYFLMSATEMPAIIVEAGFLSHPEEAALLQQETYQQKLAAAIARGIVDGFAVDSQQNTAKNALYADKSP